MSSVYKTKPGDTLFKIIDRYNCGLKMIEKLNDIKQFKLINGQMVLIPLPQNDSIKLFHHTTNGNETINDLIKNYIISYEELKYFNNLLQLILEENQSITIEHKVISPVADEFEKD